MSRNHYNKWTNQFADECSSFSPSLSTFFSTIQPLNELNNYQIDEKHDQRTAYSKQQQMPQQYRSYAQSLSKKRKSQKSLGQSSMYNYLKQLSFVKCRHNENCENHNSLKKRKANLEQTKHFYKRQVKIQSKPSPPPFYVNQIQTAPAPIVYVTQPPIYTYQQPMVYVQQRRGFQVKRPTSAPKISINYAASSKTNHVQFSQNQFGFTSPQRIPATSMQMHNQISYQTVFQPPKPVDQKVQQPIKYSINILPASQQKKVQQINAVARGDQSQRSQQMLYQSKSSASFRVQSPPDMRASDLLVYTFKDFNEQTQ